MGFQGLMRDRKVRRVRKTNIVPIVKSAIGTRKIGNPPRTLQVELISSQQRDPIFKSGTGTVEIHLVRDLSNGNHHFRVLETSFDNNGDILDSEFINSHSGSEAFDSVEDALEKALLSHDKPVLSGMGKSWIEEVPGDMKHKKMFFNRKGNSVFYSVLTTDHNGIEEEVMFPSEDSAQEFFLS